MKGNRVSNATEEYFIYTQDEERYNARGMTLERGLLQQYEKKYNSWKCAIIRFFKLKISGKLTKITPFSLK